MSDNHPAPLEFISRAPRDGIEEDLRRSYVGGTGIGSILGVNPYQSGVGLWQFLTKRAPPVEVNPDMRRGQLLERAVLNYAGQELKSPILPGPFVRSVELDIAAGHIDGIAEFTSDVVEAKTSHTRKGWGEPGTGEVPPHVAAQALWYLGLIPKAQVCWVPVLFSGLEFQMYRVDRDDRVIEQLKNLAWRWWQDHIIADVAPAPATGADVLALFPKDTGRVIVASDVVAEAVERLHDVKREVDLLESEQEQLEGQIKLHMGDAAALSLSDGTIAATWKATKPSARFDQSAFKLAQPDIYVQFCKEVSSRRFLLK